MPRCLSLFVMIVVSALSLKSQDSHLTEPGAGVILARSTAAHGYRHGYEEGYHAGNTDANLGHPFRARPEECQGLNRKYSGRYGSRSVFEKGFRSGLKAGYSDGYVGRSFRAVNTLRSISDSLPESRAAADPNFVSFDEGFLTGYDQGFDHGASSSSSTAEMDFRFAVCSKSYPKQTHSRATGNYCEGYRRGFALGHADGFAARDVSARLEASK